MPTTRPESLETEATRALLRLRRAFGALIDASPGAGTRPHEIQKRLGIDKKLAWRIGKVIHEPDVLSAAQYVPGAAAAAIFLAAAARKGISPDLLGAARAAIDGFDQVVDAHAGERAALDMMLAAASPKSRADAAYAHQKTAFSANSFIWGVQARLQMSVIFVFPAEDPARAHIAAVRGFVDLRRIRPNVPWVIGRVRCVDDDGQMRAGMQLEPIDPQPARADGLPPVPLLREFCVPPSPEMRRVRGPELYIEDELVEAPVGNRGAVTCLTGELARSVVARDADEHNRYGSVNVRVRTPVETVLLDTFIHKDVLTVGKPELVVRSDLASSGFGVMRWDRDRLDPGGDVHHLGRDPAAAYTPLMGRYADMVSYVFGKLGQEQTEFDLYRVCLPYPVMPSSAALQWELPKMRSTGG
ncbi:MAG: hypothetical protein PVJ57_09870 [Phycisphaerae bacterium]|jgi:hypothetical protein